MKLYMNPLSGNARKVIFLAGFLSLPLELHAVDLARGAQRAPEFLQKNPNGVVPVLEDGDLVLWESNAILCHLARAHAPHLLGDGARQRAEVDRWLFWQATTFGPAITALNLERVVKPMLLGLGAPDTDAVQAAHAHMMGIARILEDHLSAQPFVAGALSVADFALLGFVDTASLSGEDFASCPSITAWLTSMRALDGYQPLPPLPFG